MIYLLDTNPCIRYLNGRAPLLTRKMALILRQDIAVSIITKAELYYGSAKSQTPERSRQRQVAFLRRFTLLRFDDAAVEQYAVLRVALERQGTPISHPDMQIAAIALANDLVLVTHNTAGFSRISGLTLEDWEV
ncbi:MAG: type II toxin-antitoxin system VapC family toxin [Chloroflexota bacterium]|nr:type II toxin-antitoxin system VapC family toxin [Chloroflexota bacterium]